MPPMPAALTVARQQAKGSPYRVAVMAWRIPALEDPQETCDFLGGRTSNPTALRTLLRPATSHTAKEDTELVRGLSCGNEGFSPPLPDRASRAGAVHMAFTAQTSQDLGS